MRRALRARQERQYGRPAEVRADSTWSCGERRRSDSHRLGGWAVSRALLTKLQAYERRMGWTFPWASSLGADFNYDFQAAYTEDQQRSGASNTITGARRSGSATVRRASPWSRP
jgi:Bacterial protein of unknown function (DUF899)